MSGFDVRTIPVIGKDMYQLGQVYRIVSQPCAPDPWLAITAFFYYLPTLLWSLYAPDPLDMAFDRAGRPHHKKRYGGFKPNGMMQLDAPSGPGVKTAMFNIAQLGQRVGWYFIIADATSDFMVNWTSMAYAWSGCKVNSVSWAKAEGEYGLSGASTAPRSFDVMGPTYSHQGNAVSQPNIVTVRSTGPKTFRGTAKGHLVDGAFPKGEITGVEFFRKEGDGPTVTIPATASLDIDGKTRWEATDTIWMQDASTVQYWGHIHVSKGELYQDYAYMELVGAPDHGMTPSSDLGNLAALG